MLALVAGLLANGGAIRRDAGGGVSDPTGLGALQQILQLAKSVPQANFVPFPSAQAPNSSAQDPQTPQQSMSDMQKLGTQARGEIGKLFGTSTTPTTGPGGWQTSDQTCGLLGSGGHLGNTLNSGLTSAGKGSGGAVNGFASGGSPSNDFVGNFNQMASQMPAVQAQTPNSGRASDANLQFIAASRRIWQLRVHCGLSPKFTE